MDTVAKEDREEVFEIQRYIKADREEGVISIMSYFREGQLTYTELV